MNLYMTQETFLHYVLQAWPSVLLEHELGREAEKVIRPPLGTFVVDDEQSVEFESSSRPSQHGGPTGRPPQYGIPSAPSSADHQTRPSVEHESDIEHLLTRPATTLGYPRVELVKGLRVKVRAELSRA